MSDLLTANETLRKGATGAGLLVSVSDRGFFDTFKEAGVLAKHIAAARGSSASAVVKEVAPGHEGRAASHVAARRLRVAT
jgi:hypothetical protein